MKKRGPGGDTQPMRTFLFRIIPEAHQKVWRTVKMEAGQTLHALHLVIQQAFELKGNHMYAFYLSRRHWDVDNEYGGPASGSPRKAATTALGRLSLEKGRRFLYVFDFRTELWFEIEFIDEGEAVPKESYPLVIERYGECRMQADPHERQALGELKSILPRLIQSINNWQTSRPKARSQAVVAKDFQMVRKLYDVLKTRPEERWILLEEATDMMLVDWLLSLPSDMAARGMVEEAIQLCETFSVCAEKEYFLSEKALVLARAGRRDKAIQQVYENIAGVPRDSRVLAKAAEAFWKLNEIGHAERLYRAALDVAADDIYERELVIEGFVAMLEEHERSDEAIDLLRDELDRG